jgi:hypothetical protein
MVMGVKLYGRGEAYFETGTFDPCLHVAVTFGCGTDDYHYYGEDEFSGIKRWLVNDVQARDIAYALFKAIDHVKERRPLTEVQAAALSAAYFPEIVKLANYAVDGKFRFRCK